jgi:type IV pilus assembly protein PilV
MKMASPKHLRGRRRASAQYSKGFSLVEVMVALVIIAIGMFGIAKMQAVALSSTGASRSRALAAIEASSLASAMHANRLYWAATATVTPALNITATTTSGATQAAFISSSATLQTALNSAAGSLCAWDPNDPQHTSRLSCYCTTGSAAPCAAPYVNMAANDLFDWGTGLVRLLPNSTATVTCATPPGPTVPVSCIIAIQWIENSVSINSQESNAAKANLNTTSANTAAFQYVTYKLDVVP